MKNTSVTLGDHYEMFINDQIQSGRYSSVSEVIKAGLRILEDSEAKIQTLRKMLDEGENSGTANYSYEALISNLDGKK